MQITEGAVRLTIPAGKNELVLRHRFDATPLRGKRIRITARAKTGVSPLAVARVIVSMTTPSGVPSYGDAATTRSVTSETWVGISTVIDVDRQVGTGDISLSLKGGGAASFDDVEIMAVEEVAASPVQLTSQQLDSLAIFARVAALIRYLHPSDQAAMLDWDGFTPLAVERVLRAGDRPALLAVLRDLFGAIAPTVTFDSTGRAPPVELARDKGTHLARWHHAGLGNNGYVSHRDGRASDAALTGIQILRIKLDDLKACKKAQLQAKVQRHGAGDAAMLLMFGLPGSVTTDHERAVPPAMRELTIEADVPAGAVDWNVGVRLTGSAGLSLESLSIACDGRRSKSIDIGGEWQSWSDSDLYAWTVTRCGAASCGRFERKPVETELVADRDVMTVDLGNGLNMRMPLAVWADAKQTYPVATVEPVQRDFAIRDLPVRIAAVISAWGTLSLFYPYFSDQKIDWSASLRPALISVAAAKSSSETHEALSWMVARLQDDHARVMHAAAPINGVLPIALRRFANKLVVVGGLPEYASVFPGLEVFAIDGVPALAAYDRVHARVSAATPGWHDYAARWYLTLGPAGSFRRVHVRSPDGTESQHLLPLVARDVYGAAVKEKRPATGTEVAPGVYYVDLEGLTSKTWQGLVPALQNARAVLIDLRGYTTNAGIDALAHFTDREIFSPEWQTPLVGSTATTNYLVSQWSIRPARDQVTAPLVALIDGRAASAVETIAQIIRDNKLGMFVGETTGGTNGSVNTFTVPGEFTVRFTGLRANGPGGVTIQGRGITPDKLVVPTLDGVRAGRDEILEAGIAAAQELALKRGRPSRTR